VQKEFCIEYQIKVTRKSTDLEHTKRVGFLTRVHTQLLSII